MTFEKKNKSRLDIIIERDRANHGEEGSNMNKNKEEFDDVRVGEGLHLSPDANEALVRKIKEDQGYDEAVNDESDSSEFEVLKTGEVDPAFEDDFSSSEDPSPGTKEMEEEFNASDIDAEEDGDDPRTLGDLELDTNTGLT